MGIYKLANELKLLAINTATVYQSSFGDIQLYNNKATIKYPYCNFDIVNSKVVGSSIEYTIRIYVCDRNDPYIAYNKTKLILDTILKNYQVDATNYTSNFFTLNFKDMVNGCWADFSVMQPLEYDCILSSDIISDNENIYNIIQELVIMANNTDMVNGSDFGDIQLYNNKATIEYPYVNVDVVNSIVRNDSNLYTIRMYVCDRNDPYIAYNKCELILNNILNNFKIDIPSYTINYFTLDFKDMINGCYVDFNVESQVQYDCLLSNSIGTFIISEVGDYIVTEDVSTPIVEE